jgi:hypothetical protein
MEAKLTTFKLTNYDFAAAYLDTRYCCFIDGNANMNNNGGRKRIWFWHLRLAVNENWNPSWLYILLASGCSCVAVSLDSAVEMSDP